MLLSVVIPARNEAANIARAVDSVHRCLLQHGIEHNLVVVDDASQDDTLAIARRLRNDYPLVVLENRMGAGKGGALRTGFQHATGHMVAFLDADLEFPPESLACMAQTVLASRHPLRVVAIGVREQDYRTWFERGTSRLSRWLIRAITTLSVSDTQAGVKLFPGWFARQVLVAADQSGWLFDVEALLLARLAGLAVQEFAVVQHRRRRRRARAWELVRCVAPVIALARKYPPPPPARDGDWSLPA